MGAGSAGRTSHHGRPVTILEVAQSLISVPTVREVNQVDRDGDICVYCHFVDAQDFRRCDRFWVLAAVTNGRVAEQSDLSGARTRDIKVLFVDADNLQGWDQLESFVVEVWNDEVCSRLHDWAVQQITLSRIARAQ